MRFPVDWLHTLLYLGWALSFAHHPLSGSVSLSDKYWMYTQIHKYAKSPISVYTHLLNTKRNEKGTLSPSFWWKEISKNGFLIIWQFNIDIINATIFRHERGYDCLLLALPFIFSYHSIWNNSCCSVWGRHWCGLVGMYLEVFSGYLEFWGRRLSSLSIRQACVAPHS